MHQVEVLALMMVSIFMANVVSGTVYYWQPSSGTSDWYTAVNWNTSAFGTGSSAIPGDTDDTTVYNPGVCSIFSESNVVVNVCRIYGYGSSIPKLVVSDGASLTANGGLFPGSGGNGSLTVKGSVTVGDDKYFCVGGYNSNHASNYGELIIDGGDVYCSDYHHTFFGGGGTGVVHILNGGTYTSKKRTRIGVIDGSVGQLTMDSGAWTNYSIYVAELSNSVGTVVINDGNLDFGYLRLGQGISHWTMNDGDMNVSGTFHVGYGVGSDATFVQNGGSITTRTFYVCGKGSPYDGNGTFILSNGLFEVASEGTYQPIQIGGAGNKVIIAGGDFVTSSDASIIRENGTLEFRDGSFDLGSGYLFSTTNSLLRVLGPLADININWWRFNSSSYPMWESILELVLTKDEGHISKIMAGYTSQNGGLPKTLNIALQGGACMLSTNTLPFYWCGQSFNHTYIDPTAGDYDRDLWKVNENNIGDESGEHLELELQAAASKGSISLPGSPYASFASTAYGYVNVDGLDSGSLPELSVTITMNPVSKNLEQVVADLQSAGYTNSVVIDSSSIRMNIPADYLTTDDGHFTWDFREFDGTVNATVSAVAFQFNPKGSFFIIQ